MSAVLAPPAGPVTGPPPPPSRSAVAGLRPIRWTLADYRRIHDAGLLDGVNTVLLRGEIHVMAQPSPPHEVAAGVIEEWLRTVFTVGRHVRGQKSFDVGTDNDLGPDLAVVPGGIRDYATAAPREAVLIVEVAASSLPEDTTTKAELYATAGVPDYWVLDLVNRRLIVHRDPEPLPEGLGATAYRTRLTLNPADTVSPLAAPAASVRVADLLP